MPSMNEDLSKIRRIMAAGLPAAEQTRQSNRVPSFFTSASGGKLSGSVHPTVRPTVQTARQRMLYQGEETTTKWYKNDTPTSSEMLARIYEQYGNNREEGQKALDLFEQARRDPTSPIYNPYVDATNSAVASMAGLGYDMRGGVTKDWLEQNRALVGSYRTGSSGTPLAPSSQSTPENDAAYWYYKILSAEPETENAETEWAALQEEVRYWTGRADRNYSDEEILAKINWADYPTLVRMDEGREKGTPLALNRPVGYSQDALYGVIWAARNDSTGDPLVDSVKAVLGQGNMWREDTALSARLDPTSAEYSPYSAGSTLDDAALYFGVSEFSSDWLDSNRSYLGGNDATAKQMYQKVYDAEQTTLQAEEELNSLWDSVDEWMKYSSDPDAILSGLLDDCPTLRKMDESRKSGNLIATTRAVDYRWEDVEAEVRRRCEQVNTATQGGAYTEQVGDMLGLPLPHAESDIALEKSRDNAINAGAGTIMDQGTEEEKSVFQTAYSSNFGDYLLEINRAINEGVTDPQGGYAYCLERADSYAAENYLDAKAVVAPYETMQQEVEAAREELDALQSQLWVRQEMHSRDEKADQASAPLKDRYHTMAAVGGSDWELYAERIEGTNQYRFTGAYNSETGEFLDPIPGTMNATLFAKGEMFAQSIGSEGETTERKDYTPEEQERMVARVEELEDVITSGNAYLQTHAGAYENSRKTMQQIDDGYAVADRMAELAGLEKGDASSTKAALDFVYAFGAEYKPTEWVSEDLYTAALQEGNSYEQVARAAQLGMQENKNAISQIDYALDWIENNGVSIDQTYLDNMQRERARLEREVKAADYFMLQDREDFDSVVAQTSATVSRPVITFGATDNALTYYAVHPEEDMAFAGRAATQMALLTDQERRTYLYLYGKEGADAAREYYDYLTDSSYGVVSARTGKALETVFAEFARDMPVTSSLLSVIASPLQMAGAIYSVGASLSGQEMNPYHGAFAATQMVGTVRGTVKEEIAAGLGEGTMGSFLANLGYDALTSAGDSLMNAYLMGGVNLGSGEAASGLSAAGLKISESMISAAPMGVQAASGAIRDAKLRGADDAQALMMGGATFLAETLSEAITVDNIRSAFKNGETSEAAKDFLRGIILSGMEEGAGEMASEFLSTISDEWIMGKLSARAETEMKYIAGGMDPEEARLQSWVDAAKEILYSGLTGFVSSGISTGAGYVAGAVNRDTGNGNGTLQDAQRTAREASPEPAETDFPFMSDTFGPEEIELTNSTQQNSILSRQMAALTMAMTTTDEASVTATIGAVLQQSPDGSNSMAGVAAQHMVSRLGAVKAATVTQNVLLTAAESGIPVEQAQSALAVAALASGQAQQVLGEIADNNAMSPESIARLTAAAETDMQDPAIMQQVEQTVTNNRVATRVAAIVADGGLEGIASYETALGQARQNRDNAQAALEQVRRQQTVAAENLQSAYAQFSADPGNQTMRGSVQQAIKDAEGTAKVVAEYEQSLKSAETAMQGARTTLSQMRDSTMRRIRQQAQEEVLEEDQRVAQRKESLRMNAEAAASHIEANIRKVAEMEPVAKLKGDEFTMGEGLRAQVTDYFRSIGTVVNPEIGEISLTRRGIKSSFAHGMTSAKAAAFAAVPAVLENGKVIDAQANWKGRNYDTFVVAAPVSIGEMKDGMCATIVSRNSNGQQYYLHEVRFLDTEKGGFASGISATDTEPGTSETEKQTHPIDSIIDRVLQVKRKASRISENIDIRYHKAGSFALTGEPISRQMQDITKRLAAGQEVDVASIMATPEVQWAEANQLKGESIPYRKQPYTQAELAEIITPERASVQDDILDELMSHGSAVLDSDGKVQYTGPVKQEKRLDVVIGPPAAGKSSALVDPISQRYGSRVLDSDMVKELLPEYNGGLNSGYLHNESRHIWREMQAEAIAQDDNVVLPIVGHNLQSVLDAIQPYREAGYIINAHYLELDGKKAMGRALNRFLTDGRYIDPKYLASVSDGRITQVYDQLKGGGMIDGYSHWSNDVPQGQRPIQIEAEGEIDLRDFYGRNAHGTDNAGGPGEGPATNRTARSPQEAGNGQSQIRKALKYTQGSTPQQQQGASSIPRGAPKSSPARIAKDLVKALGIGDAMGTRRMNRVPRAVQGYYETRARYIAVRSRQAGNYTVTMHEVFHHLADRLGMTGTQDMVNNLDPVFAASYAPAELPGEAFAEFGWRYMEDEALARQFAGDAFVDQFEARLRQEGLQKTVHDAARQLRIWLNATVNDRIGATIVDKNKATKPGSIRAQLRAMISRHIDDTAAAEPVNASIRKESGNNNVPLNQDVRANALMKNFASRRAYAILTENLTDANWNVTGESLASRFERVGLKAKDAKLLNEYMLALHSLDRDAQGKPVFDTVGVPADQRQRLIDDVQQNHPEVAAAEKEFQAFRREFLQAFLVDTGYLSQADFDKMNAMYPHYVSTYRVKDGARRGGSSKAYRIRRASGSTEDIINPMDSFVSMVDSVVTMVSANNAALAWDSAYRQNEGLGAFGREITPDMHQVSVDVSRLQNQIAQLLSGNTDADVFQQVIDLFGTRQIQWVPQSAANMANVITVQRSDGSVGYYEMFDPELYKLLSSQRDGSGSSNKLWSTLGKVTRAMSMLTTGSNPVFAVRNFMRDFQNSVNYGSWASNYGSGFMKWMRAAYDVWTKSGEYQDYVALGGGGWTRIEAGTKKGANDYRSALYKGYNTSSMGNAVKWAGQKVWDTVTLSRLNEVIEQTSRFAEYRYGKHDKSTSEGKMEAFLAAQDVTVDFARMGNSGTASVLKQLVPFLGASTQGVYRTGRSLTEAERGRAPQRFAKTVINTALASAISAAIMLKFSDDEEKEAFAMMSDDLKSQHLYFPNFAKDVLGQQPLIRIPLAQDPLTYAIHGAVTDAIWNGTTDEMVIDIASIANTIVDNLTPFKSGTIFEPLLAVTRNRNWYGSRIVPSYMGDWHPTTQYTEETPDLFVNIGRAVGMSPLNVQYLAEQYSGFLGQMVVPAISRTDSGELGGLQATIAATQKRFTSDPLISNDVVGSVYDNAAFLTQVTDAAKNNRPVNMLRRGLSEDERKAAYQEAYDLTHKGGIIADAKTFLSDGYDRIDEINANDTLTPEQKYTLTSDVRREMIEVALEANEAAAAYNEKYVAGLNIATNALYEGAYLTIPTAMDKLDQVFKADSDQMYMQRATEVWEATGNDSALPHPNTSYTSKGVTYEVGVEDMENWMAQYKMGYQDYLVKNSGNWGALNDEERLEILKGAHSAGHDAARKWHMKLHGIK